MKVRISRSTDIPDTIRLERFRASPDLGPKLLFFSGGSGLRDLSREIIRYSYNSIHLITPFDSGGSSAELRKIFHMPAVGDVRNRLMALSDQSIRGNPEIYALFAHRLPKRASRKQLAETLSEMIAGRDLLVRRIYHPMRKIIRNYLKIFRDNMTENFDLRGASIGNLVLTGGYISYQRHFDPVVYIFSKLVEVRGVVRPVVDNDCHLAAELDNGERVIGQHLLTGKEQAPLDRRIERLFLVSDLLTPKPVGVHLHTQIRHLIGQAELICYPMGSFFTSIIASLLPKGVGKAIAANPCAKIFIPNSAPDPELNGYSLAQQIETLLSYLRKDDPEAIGTNDVLNFILVDRAGGQYTGNLDQKKLAEWGIDVIDCDLVSETTRPFIDAKKLTGVLLSLI